MKQFTAKALVFAFFSLTFLPANTGTAYAAASLYESMTGTNGSNLGTGSSDSVGFTGNWSMVNAYKLPRMSGVAAIYSNSYNSNLKFPTGSRFTVPANNTAASTAANVWNVYYSARQMTTGVNFDSNGTFYFSFLDYAPDSGGWGSAVVGLLNGLPSTENDATKNSIDFGRTYSGAPTIHFISANQAAWNVTPYTATGTANTSVDSSGKSWFVVAKFTTAASGNDTIQVKFFASTDTVPQSDSSITWDVSYSTPITGTYSYLAVQNEYNGTIDELRGDATYAAVAGIALAPTIGSPSVSGTPNKGITTTVSVTVGAAGYMRFYLDGKRIPGCLTRPTTGSSPNFTVTCNWKPPVKGVHRIYATFTSTDSSYTNATTPVANIQVVPRTNTR
jgi:hypothetical protein